MLELYVVKATRTVPRRERGGNPSDLADKVAKVARSVLRGGSPGNGADLPDVRHIVT